MRLNIILYVLTSLIAFPALAIVDLSVAVTPERPYTIDPLTVHVTFTSSNIEFEVETSVVDDVISIRLQPIPCLVTCPPFERTLDVDFDPLPFGVYDLVILNEIDEILLTERLLIDGASPYHRLRPELYVEPREPTDDDAIRVLIPMLLPETMAHPSVEPLRREGQDLIVELMNSPQGEPGEGELVTPMAELGQLEPGTYRLFIYLTEYSLPSDLHVSELVALRALEVVEGDDAVDLQDRFTARISWTDFAGLSGSGQPVADPTLESTLFTFFSPGNWELLIKVLDGCAINDYYWVLTAAATNVEYTIEIDDAMSGQTWTYTNPLGMNSPAVTDIEAFACAR